jgi:hypothetical protein
MNPPLFHNRIRKVCTLVTATLIIPALVHAQNSQGDNQLAALKAQITALQKRVTALENQLTAARSVLALAPFVTVDPNPEIGVIGPNIVFSGANIHILSGSGATDDNISHGGSPTGLGNLIIGYDEDPASFGGSLSPGDRGGSHNLVIGPFNRFTSSAFGGLVAGQNNTISAQSASVSGGSSNIASGDGASVSGGNVNTASGAVSSVSGGQLNTSNDTGDSVSGGSGNTCPGVASSISGGLHNTVSGLFSVVIGGNGVTLIGSEHIAPQPPFP